MMPGVGPTRAVIQVAPGDLVAVEADGQYYYALILDHVKLFGGNWVFAFHTSSGKVLDAAQNDE